MKTFQKILIASLIAVVTAAGIIISVLAYRNKFSRKYITVNS